MPRSAARSTRWAAYDGVSTTAAGASSSIARTSRSLFPVPTGMWHEAEPLEGGERGTGDERAGVVGRHDALRRRGCRTPRSCAPSP